MGAARGNVRKSLLRDVLLGTPIHDDGDISADRLDSPVTCMKVVTAGRDRYLVAGDDDGVVRIWSAG